MGGGPVQAVLSSEPEGKGLTVEFLSEIKGVSHETIVEYARDNTLHSPDVAESLPIRVLDPVMLLAGKVRNAVDIEQASPEKPRQDVKHVAILALCVPHFLEEVRVQVPNEQQRKETLGNYIRMLAALQHSYSGRQFQARYPGAIHWQELIPKRDSADVVRLARSTLVTPGYWRGTVAWYEHLPNNANSRRVHKRHSLHAKKEGVTDGGARWATWPQSTASHKKRRHAPPSLVTVARI